MQKLNQVLAVEKGMKPKVYNDITEADKILQKSDLLKGITKVYTPKDEEDAEVFPSENTLVQINASVMLDKIQQKTEEIWNVTATKDWANCVAKADIKLDNGTVIAEKVPVTFLLYLDKQLFDLRTLASRLPVLDPSKSWSVDEASGAFKSNTIKTHKTAKKLRAIVKYDATPQHPAQTETFTEDVIVGYWDTTHFSGAINAKDRTDMVDRIDEVLRAVRSAREEANMIEAENKTIAGPILDYIFG